MTTAGARLWRSATMPAVVVPDAIGSELAADARARLERRAIRDTAASIERLRPRRRPAAARARRGPLGHRRGGDGPAPGRSRRCARSASSPAIISSPGTTAFSTTGRSSWCSICPPRPSIVRRFTSATAGSVLHDDVAARRAGHRRARPDRDEQSRTSASGSAARWCAWSSIWPHRAIRDSRRAVAACLARST